MSNVPQARYLWLKRAALVLLAPLIFFGAGEGILRIVGYGDPATFFQEVEINGKKFTVENPYFGQRFFRRHLPRTPAWNLIPEPRDGVPRIAVIGESAAQGYPLQKLGLASMLEGILSIEYPGRQFDFINACMTSVNSHILEEVVPEVVAQRPDVAVIYMGNNEVVGPYGPGTPFTAWTRSRMMVWLDKKLSATRSYQLLGHLLARLTPSEGKKWEGFQMFSELRVPADSPALPGVYDGFARNLGAIVDHLLRGGSRVVLCTVAVNLADWGPSGSPPLRDDEPAAKLLAQARELSGQGDAVGALARLQAAAELAPENAGLLFLLGMSLRADGQTAAARRAFEQARDLDRHRFRADAKINAIIRATAAKFAGRGVALVDVDRELVPDGIPGRDQFLEHVHLTFEGMSRLGILVAEAVGPLLPELGAPRKFSDADVPELRQRLFFTPFDEVFLANAAREIGEMPIFRQREGSLGVSDYWRARESAVRQQNSLDEAQLQSFYVAAKRQRPDALLIDASCADYLSRLRDTSSAAAMGAKVLARKPTYFEGLRFMADEARQSGQSEKAEQFYRRALDIYRLIPDAWKNLGDLAWQRGRKKEALDCYATALSQDAGNAPAALALAELYSQSGETVLALNTLLTARTNNPQNADVENALGRLHAASGDSASARASFARALEIDPKVSPRELLRLTSEQCTPGEAKAAFQKYEPQFGGDAELYNNFAWLLATSPANDVRDPVAALRLAQRAIDLAGSPNAYFYGTLAAAQASQGDFESALVSLNRAKSLAADNPDFLASAAQMEAAFSGRKPYQDDR